MTLFELKMRVEALLMDNPDAIVVMAKDGEGNGFSPLDDVVPGTYTAESTYSGEAGILKLTKELREHGYTEEDVKDERAIVLWPTN